MHSSPAIVDPEAWPPYKNWSALAGYFDGDGTVEFSIHEFTLKVRLAFDENWKLHLEGLKRFLEIRGIRCGAVRRKDGFNTWHVVVSNIDGVKLMAKKMLPYLSKKRIELKAVLDHYGDRITGDQFVEIMNRLVLAGSELGSLAAQDQASLTPVAFSNRAGRGKRNGSPNES